MENIKKMMWSAGKVVLLISIVMFVVGKVIDIIEAFWTKWLLHRFEIFAQGDFAGIFTFLASIFLTAFSLLLIGYLLGLKSIRRFLNFLSKHVPLFSYIWTDEEGMQKFTPTLFQNPRDGEYKIGFITGEQAMDDGTKYWRVFFFTGIGDHELIDQNRPDLLKPLANPAPEILKLIGSFMTSGPKMLYRKKNGSILPEKQK